MMRDIGKNIRELRLRAGFSQDELAERLFVTRMWSKFCIWRKSSVRMPTPCSTVRRCRKAGGVLSAALLLAAV